MKKTECKYTCFVGIDVSKDSLDVAIGSQAKSRRFANTNQGVKELAA